MRNFCQATDFSCFCFAPNILCYKWVDVNYSIHVEDWFDFVVMLIKCEDILENLFSVFTLEMMPQDCTLIVCVGIVGFIADVFCVGYCCLIVTPACLFLQMISVMLQTSSSKRERFSSHFCSCSTLRV